MRLPDELVIASHNAGKVREIHELVQPLGIDVISASELDLPEPEENGDTFEANAAIKSESAAILSGKWSLADDSGLCVPALNDDPGIYSARWAGPSKDFNVAIEKIREAIIAADAEPQGAAAYFVCVLALSAPNHDTLFFRGEVHGTLTFPPRGEKGFGYDPIFVATGNTQTFAEIEPAEKHAISHRARAFALFLEHLQAQAA
ncbi:MAG: RdgB/HAM1 family non-canonical purine NTP pyrophosphatase [Rickettsiales bacterium]|nr:RdgB/HAM1 family non-canonical purine NTP pyrophosphatase [Rickettsiales bacterium]